MRPESNLTLPATGAATRLDLPSSRCATPTHSVIAAPSGVSRTSGDLGRCDVVDREAVRSLPEYVEKPWVHEPLRAPNRHEAGKILFARAGEGLSLHCHEGTDETIRVPSGRMRIRAGVPAEGLEAGVLEPGMRYAVPSPGSCTGLRHSGVRRDRDVDALPG